MGEHEGGFRDVADAAGSAGLGGCLPSPLAPPRKTRTPHPCPTSPKACRPATPAQPINQNDAAHASRSASGRATPKHQGGLSQPDRPAADSGDDVHTADAGESAVTDGRYARSAQDSTALARTQQHPSCAPRSDINDSGQAPVTGKPHTDGRTTRGLPETSLSLNIGQDLLRHPVPG